MLRLLKNLRIVEIEDLLRLDSTLANAGIPLSLLKRELAHPLHRICDGVMGGWYSDEEAQQLAELFVEYGAHVNGWPVEPRQDTPLIAACSMHADRVAKVLLRHHADIHHQGCMGGTALHWAAWTGRDQVVEELLKYTPDLSQRCLDNHATPLFWAVHGYKNANGANVHNQIRCAQLLVRAGSDLSIPNGSGLTVFDLLDEGDAEMRNILQNTNASENSTDQLGKV